MRRAAHRGRFTSLPLHHTIGMRQSALKSGCLPVNGEDRQMLVLGYQGTLQPDPTLCQAAGPGYDHASGGIAVPGGWPPQMEALIEPLLARALLGLERRTPAVQRVFGGELIPLDALLELLRERLRGILAQAIAAHLETADHHTLLVERDLICEFPVLLPLLQQAVSEWIAAMAAFHDRLQRDGQRLAAWLGVATLPPLESVSGTTSDTHPGGHVVLRIVFSGGCCVYYKPRPISGEWLWHRLLEAVAEAEPALRLPAVRVLEGSSPARYGWTESVLPLDRLRGSPDGTRYWHAAGAMLCLAHHVSLTDLHLGNVIATPSGPAVIDAECLGTPRFVDTPASGNSRGNTAFGAFFESLIGAGLLPRKLLSRMPDVSGLFGSAAPVSGLGLPQWFVASDGSYSLATAPAVLLDHGNAPGRTSALTAMPQLLAGYRQAAGVLLHIRKALLASGSHWRSVLEREHAPRVVLRDTLTYGILLSQSLEPGNLRSEYRRQAAFRGALRRDAPVAFPKALVRKELQALRHLHVPRFMALPGTRTLASGCGGSLASNFSVCTPAEEVLRRMEELSLEKLEAVHIPALLLAILNLAESSR